MICHHALVFARENRTGKLARLKVEKLSYLRHRGLRHIAYLGTISIFKGLEICDLKIPIFLKENYLSHSEKLR